LQTEEQRILKKIENTRRKAEQILAIKRINEERYQHEMFLEQQKQERLKEQQAVVLQ
jgi:hypothetical protein